MEDLDRADIERAITNADELAEIHTPVVDIADASAFPLCETPEGEAAQIRRVLESYDPQAKVPAGLTERVLKLVEEQR